MKPNKWTAFILFGVLLWAFYVVLFFSLLRFNFSHLKVVLFLFSPINFSLNFFNPNEYSHMVDVKKLFTITNITFVIWNALAFFCRKKINQKNSGWTIVLSTICISILIFITGYRRFWRFFHIVLFPQGNYLFEKESVMIQLYPSSFFIIYIAGVIGTMFITGALLIYIEKNKSLEKFLRDDKSLSTNPEIKSHELYQAK